VSPKSGLIRRQPESQQVLSRPAIKQIRMAQYFKDDTTTVHEDNTSDEEMPPEIKENLISRLEQEILGNIDVNFLFNKGDRLRFGLIDQHRLYKIMLKIKEVA
jgi:hypothetical protein